jgi:hypothetical protein
MTDPESNCFQWLEDLRVLFIEGEDEQRATIPSNASIKLHGKKLKKERDTIKRIGLQLKGLDSKSISDICKGKTSKITFALYVEKRNLFKFAKENQSYLTQLINKYKNKINYTYKKANSYAQTGIGSMFTFISSVTGLISYATGTGNVAVSLVGGLVGIMLLLTNPPISVDENKDMIEKLNKELSIVTGIQDMDIKLIETDPDTYDFRVTVQRKSLVEAKKDHKGEKVPFLAKPTSRPQKFKF